MSFTQPTSKFLVVPTPVCNAASDWPHTFLNSGCVCLVYHYYLEDVITSSSSQGHIFKTFTTE